MSSPFSLSGRLVGPYTVIRKIGEGGMGAVYEAVNKATGRHVAIKFLHEEFQENQELLGRFFNEAIASSTLDHPGMVQIFDSGMLDGETPYLIMEYLRGSSLEQRITALGGKQGLPLREALNVAWQTAAVLAELETRSIVHRDLKPGNLMLVPDAVAAHGVRVKILDLGLAKLNRELYASAVHTRCGMVMGTPLYMSPEQCSDASDVDGKTDVYSLGIVLFEMLTGQPPFITARSDSILTLHLFAPVPRLSDVTSGAPEALDELVFAMLSKIAAERPAMAEVRDRLARLLAEPLPHAGALEVAYQPIVISEDSVVTSPAPADMLSRLAKRVQQGGQAKAKGKAKAKGGRANVAASHTLARTDPAMAAQSSATTTRLLVAADLLGADTQENLRPPSFSDCSQSDRTVYFVRRDLLPPPLRPRATRSPALLGGLVFLVLMLLCMDRDTPSLSPGPAVGAPLPASAAIESAQSAPAR